ncbi:MAG: hypothetical protein ACYDAD_09140 [Acidimicrobiales bacterium]
MSRPTVATTVEHLGRPRWRGQPGRVEVWYATFTGADGTGYWIHHETVAPAPRGDPYGHGWAAVFSPGAPPAVSRFGPGPVAPGSDGSSYDGAWFASGGARVAAGHMTGAAGDLSWDIDFTDSSPPLYTFPRALWERELLPGAQVVPWPRARFRGTFNIGSSRHVVDATGAVARIYGHGNAERWCWLHAEAGDGTLLELVAAVPRRPGLRRLPPMAMVRLREPGRPDWPSSPLLGAPRFRTRVSESGFSVTGAIGRRRLLVEATVPRERCVVLTYVDPDGQTATCTNSERADAEIVLTEGGRSGTVDRRWTLEASAHAEIGTRP